jgi:hypothetical protein
MQVFTLQQLFGENASQSATTLNISKVDLAAVGLTPTPNNTAESFLVAIILNLLAQFEGEVYDLVDSSGAEIVYASTEDAYETFYCFYWRKIKDDKDYVKDQIVINAYSIYAQAN